MIEFPNDREKGFPTRQNYGVHIDTGGAERYDMINANKITVYDIDASTASIKDASIVTAKIQDLAVTDAKIKTVTASKITTGQLQANQIISVGPDTGARIDIIGGASGTAAIQLIDSSGNTTGQLLSDGTWWFGDPTGSNRLYWDGTNLLMKTEGTSGVSSNNGFIVVDGNNNEVGRINDNAFVAREGKAFAAAVDSNFDNWGQMYGSGGDFIFEAPSGGTENIKFMDSTSSNNVFTITSSVIGAYKDIEFKVNPGGGTSEHSLKNIDALVGYNDIRYVLGNDSYYHSFADADWDEHFWIDLDGDFETEGDGQVDGDFNVTGTKNFRIQHPNQDDKWIKYSAIESPEIALKIRGRAELKKGKVKITLPKHWKLTTEKEKTTVQLTPMGDCNGLFVDNLKRGSFTVKELNKGNSNIEFCWELTATRKGYSDFEPVQEKTKKDKRMELRKKHNNKKKRKEVK